MAPEREEVIVDADPGGTEEVLPALRDPSSIASRGATYSAVSDARSRCGQGFAIELAVGSERERVQDDERLRHHMCGERLVQAHLDVRRGQGIVPLYEVGDEGIVEHRDGGIDHARERAERGLDLSELDAEAA